MKKKIEKAAVVVSHEANALLNMPSLMLCVFSWLIVSCVLVVVLILARRCWAGLRDRTRDETVSGARAQLRS